LVMIRLQPADLDRLRPHLAQTINWTRLDFLRDYPLVKAADRINAVETLTGPQEADDDLRFQHDGIGIFARRLAWDSTFFGYPIVRIDAVYPLEPRQTPPDYVPALREFIAHLQKIGVRCVLVNVYAEDLDLLRALGSLRLFQIKGKAEVW
jgi:hypothetical protein